MKNRIDVYDDVLNRLREGVAKGTFPWRRSWITPEGYSNLPTSLATGKTYRGVNVWLLGMAPYACKYWGTYRQIQKLGGQVRTGETGTKITLYKVVEKKKKDPATGEKKVVDRYFFLKYFTVFNAEQADGLELPAEPEPAEPVEFNPISAAEEIAAGYTDGPEVRYGGSRAYYAPAVDRIQMPPREHFEAPEYYYGTLFHEQVHSTGHETRLNRDLRNWFGTEPYAKEELVAEIGAAFLLGMAGIDANEVLDNSAAYLRGWMEKISEDPKLLVSASSAAQAAADRILGAS